MKRRETQPRRLRKQPKMRRMDAAISMPRLRVPQKARRRRRRNRVRARVPLASLRQILLSARWLSLGLLAFSLPAKRGEKPARVLGVRMLCFRWGCGRIEPLGYKPCRQKKLICYYRKMGDVERY